MKRLAALITFKQGVSKQEAARALKHISRVLDIPEETWDYVPTGKRSGYGGQQVAAVKRPTDIEKDIVKEYEEEHGSPTFYIP